MTRILIVTDIEAKTKDNVRFLKKLVKKVDPDIVAILGDYFDQFLLKECSNIHQVQFLYSDFLRELASYRIPVIVNPGNKDVRIFDVVSLSHPEITYPRLKSEVVGGLKIYAIPGSEEAIGDPRIFYVTSLDLLISSLSLFSLSLQNLDILVTHKGPKTDLQNHVYGNGVDYACFRASERGEIISTSPTNHLALKDNMGSESLRVLFEVIQPRMGVCGHFHEGTGVDKIGKSIIINPGSFCENKFNKKHNYAMVIYKQGIQEIILGNSEGEYYVDLIGK